MTEVITYTFEYINNLSKQYKFKIENEKMIRYFNDIKKNNKFNPRFTKKFNYTNWKNSINKEEEREKNESDILLEKVNSFNVDLIVLAGYMKKISEAFTL